MQLFARMKDSPSPSSIDAKQPTTTVSSPPLTLTTSSSSMHSPKPAQTQYKTNPVLKYIRLTLALLCVAIGATILGCEGHVFHTYNRSVMGGEWYLPLWPVNLDLRTGVMEAVVGAVVVVAMGGYIISGLMGVKSTNPTQNIVFAFCSIVGVVVSLIGLIYVHIVTFIVDKGDRDTLMTFTCGLYDNARDFARTGAKVSLPVSSSTILPSGFGRVCVESQVSRWMVVGLFVVEILCLGVAVVGVIGDKKAKMRNLKGRDDGFGNEKSGFA